MTGYSVLPDGEELARKFHEAYERLAVFKARLELLS